MPERCYPFVFDPETVLKAFGGIREVHRILIELECDVTERAVRKWLERGVVPADAVIALHLYAKDNGGPDILSMAIIRTHKRRKR